ncbi:phenylalanyl-tRNA synthetase beta chain [Kineosphaera limosa]|uniref:Phenylalanine--tRNA ligase beta subunit n=1 Tax=Kineosphaera limosa NBRC 100340 TaxID=1184609 RepID=K6WVZ7_9MICO|nr:phenylalanine--tRNA ligase subunit beta [Kineosphaera limosa]NYD99226.1 phenylalanyl-tRNA synthetase beta chain [Kineosphaera limosa]GAB96262.1 phenylalanine--tRNA ligase beta subunit [Kineosphaera limosa NBRC 100340]
MRAPVSWLRELVDVDPAKTGVDIAADLVKVGLEEEGLHGGDIVGPLVVGRVLDKTDEPQKNGKTIHFCHVDVGNHGQRAAAGGDESVTQEIVCGAHNFGPGDLVVVVLPGATLPGGFAISARKTYGHMSNGMICSAAELGLGEDHDGIIVLTEYFADSPEVVARLQPGQDAIELLGLADEVVEVNVTPDRGYAFSLRGIARDLALATGATASFRDPVGEQVQPPAANDAGFEVRLIDDAPIHGSNGNVGCDRYVARIVRDVDTQAASPSWMTTRLTQVGMRPISLAVDITNYLMMLTGQPLHAFDLDTLSGAIEVRRARPGETLKTLDDVTRTLHPQDLLITDGGDLPLAIAGVMGGETSEVGPTTSNVLIEAAHFDPITVARSSRRHKLSTEASKRFERGVDPAMTAKVAQLAAQLLADLGGGTIDPGVTDVDERVERDGFAFDTALAWRLVQPPEATGGQVPDGLDHEAVVATLRDLGCEVTEVAEATEVDRRPADFGRVQVQPPSWRPDLANGPDLVEEVARIRGYDRIPSVLPIAPAGRGLTRAQRALRLAGAVLAGLGLTEVWSYPFVGAEVFDKLGHSAQDQRRTAVRLANPLSDEQPLLRTNILDTLLATLRLNVNRGARDVAVFEHGLVVRPQAVSAEGVAKAPIPPVGQLPDEATLAAITAAVPRQPRHLAIALSGDADPAGPWGAGRPFDATDAIGAATELARALGVELVVAADAHSPFHPGRCAALSLPDGTLVGHAGEVHPKVCAAFDLPARTCAAELDLDAIIAAAGDPVQVQTLSTLPVAHSDVALVVDESVPAADVRDALRAGAGEALESLRLFDVFRGEQLGEGRKSLAYRMTFRPRDKTMTTAQVSELRDAAVARANAATGAIQRG